MLVCMYACMYVQIILFVAPLFSLVVSSRRVDTSEHKAIHYAVQHSTDNDDYHRHNHNYRPSRDGGLFCKMNAQGVNYIFPTASSNNSIIIILSGFDQVLGK